MPVLQDAVFLEGFFGRHARLDLTADVLVSQGWVAQAFTALDDGIEAYHWSAIGATHIPTPQGETQQVSIPWFRWKLLGDNEACKAFKAMPMGGDWDSVREQNAVNCN